MTDFRRVLLALAYAGLVAIALPVAVHAADAGAAKKETAKPEVAKPEVSKSEPAKPESAKTEASKPEPAKPESKKAEAKPILAYIVITGAPGDGETSLATALKKRLSAFGVKEGSAQSAEVYSIEATVETAPAGKSRQGLRIIWRVFAPDGTMLGGVSQMKLVRKGSLDKKWGRAADSAATDAAYRIAKLIPR